MRAQKAIVSRGKWYRHLAVALGAISWAGVSLSQSQPWTAQPGFPFTVPGSPPFLNGGVAVGDVDNDGHDDIAIPASNGSVYVVTVKDVGGTPTPSVLWSYSTASTSTGVTAIDAEPAIADVDGDGFNEVVVAAGSFGSRNPGGVFVIDHTGSLVCSYVPATGLVPLSVASAPAIGNLDGNSAGRLQIVFPELAGFVTAIDTAGVVPGGACHVVWRHDNRETNGSSAALVDINGDGILDVVTGGGSHKETAFNTIDGGIVQVLDGPTGNPVPPWPHSVDEVVTSSPIVVSKTVPSPTIFVGTGFCWSKNTAPSGCPPPPDGYQGEVGKYLNGFDSSGAYLPGWPVSLLTTNFEGYAQDGGAVGLFDRFGEPKLLFRVIVQDIPGMAGTKGRLLALNADGTNFFPPVDPLVPTGPGTSAQPSLTPPIVADLLGQGIPQIIMGGGGAGEVLVFDSAGNQLTRQTCCPENPTFSLKTGAQAHTVTAVADIDGDGKLELIEASALGGVGTVYAWKFSSSDASVVQPWPTYRHDASNTARFEREEIFASGFE